MARGLVAAGDDVFVWTPSAVAEPTRDEGVHVRRLPDHFGPASLAQLEGEMARAPGRMLLQYTPHAFGWKGMNVPLCLWLWSQRKALDVMFHEVAFPWDAQQRYKHRLLGLVQRGMASLLVRGAERIFVSIPGWVAMLKPLAVRFPAPVWMPVPSNVESSVTPDEIQAVRRDLAGPACTGLVGHFGTYGPLVTQFLQPAIVQLLERMPGVRVLLLGHGSDAFARRFLAGHEQWTARMASRPDLDERAVSTHLTACDVLLQPYPDGICSRRGSAMAGISLGMPLVTTEGSATEPLWRETRAVAITRARRAGGQSVRTAGRSASARGAWQTRPRVISSTVCRRTYNSNAAPGSVGRMTCSRLLLP